jgi:hypothetical protein
MKRSRKTIGALAATAIVMSLMVLAPTPAAARHINCGIITEDTTLTNDVLGCEGYGLIIRADNITLNLDGHTVSCENTFAEQVGILLDDVSGVTVQNGTVEGCDAGVSIEGGGDNTVRRMIARDNVNDLIEPFDPTMPPPEGFTLADITCDYGDGILTFNSSNNLIERNWVHGNGPYSGISMVEDGSDGNIVRNNRVEDNNLTNTEPTDVEGNPIFVDSRRFLDAPTNTVPNPTWRQHVAAGSPGAVQPAGMCGATEPGAPGMQRGRAVQDIGIRVEGPGSDDNRVNGNQVDNSALVGISVHSYVCNAQPGDPRGDSPPNLNNFIERNKVTGTGNETVQLDSFADGIGLLAQGPIGNVTCGSESNVVRANSSNDNRRHGISVNADNANNTVQRNQANDNDVDGITVAGGGVPATDNTINRNRAADNGRFDGSDFNGISNTLAPCDNNNWSQNQFGTVNQECVGDGAVPIAAAAGASASASADDDVPADDDVSGVTRGPRVE